MSRRPQYLDELTGTAKETGRREAGPSQRQAAPAEAAKTRVDPAPSAAQGSSSRVRSLPPSSAHPGSTRPHKSRKRQFGVGDADLQSDPEEVQPPSKKKPSRKGKKTSEGMSGKKEGAVILGVEDLSQDIREATAHLVPTFNEVAEAIPLAKNPAFEDLSPEDVVSAFCSHSAKVTILDFPL